ncbi:group II intron reverse transcriptase/maturase [Rhodopila sp.]|uniref:group II intron reverse transcriptase/maturase n=2 Tax=Rhodopila sp. TaxID=2480087 RepID=UPI003D0EBF13
MSLETPDKIRSLQRKLYRKAKAEPAFRFYILYDKICRADILLRAYTLTHANAGAPGVDGMTFGQIEAAGLEGWLASLREDLVSKTYRPDPVRRVMIPKPGGGERPLGIPTIRDRVVQAAAKIVLEPVFEADFEDGAYGYRPRRSAIDAVKETHRLLCRGYTDVVDADLSKYFDTIPHADLLRSVGRRIVDRNVLRLIKLWLQVPVEERDGDGKRRMSGGKSNTRGTPQGGVASPLLSVIYMNRFLKHWRLTGRGEAFRAHVICYADDFIILSRGHAEEALTWTKAVMTKLGLTLNEAKTSVKNARREGFDFLGYTLGPRHLPNGGRWYLGASPSKKSVQRVKVKVGELLVPGNKGAWDEVRARLNRVLRGWSAYFSYGALASAYETVDQHVYDRTRHFLRQRHKVQGRGTDQFSRDHVYGELAVRSLRRERSRSSPWALR